MTNLDHLGESAARATRRRAARLLSRPVVTAFHSLYYGEGLQTWLNKVNSPLFRAYLTAKALSLMAAPLCSRSWPIAPASQGGRLETMADCGLS